MDFLIHALPVIIVLLVVGIQIWRTWKHGLFLALVQLGITVVAGLLSYLLIRLLLNPAWVDLFGLGALLLEKVPEGFVDAMPQLEAFLLALPTAILALICFTLLFDLLCSLGCKLLYKLNDKHKWSEKFLRIKPEKAVTAVVAVLIALVCMIPDLMILSGTLTFAGNLLYCAASVTDEPIFTTTGDFVHRLEESAVIRVCNALGADQLFFGLTTAQRDGETFSVGEELNQMSEGVVGILPVYEVLNTENGAPTPEQLRALPEALGGSPEALGLTVGLARSYREELGGSDAVMIVSQLIGTSPERFEEYLGQMTTDTAQEDLTTFCEIAAMLGDRGLLPGEGEEFDTSVLSDPELLEAVQAEVAKNSRLTAFFGTDSTIQDAITQWLG